MHLFLVYHKNCRSYLVVFTAFKKNIIFKGAQIRAITTEITFVQTLELK